MKSPLRHFSNDKWDATDSCGACWHITQKARCDRHASLDTSKNAHNKKSYKDTPHDQGSPPHAPRYIEGSIKSISTKPEILDISMRDWPMQRDCLNQFFHLPFTFHGETGLLCVWVLETE